MKVEKCIDNVRTLFTDKLFQVSVYILLQESLFIPISLQHSRDITGIISHVQHHVHPTTIPNIEYCW